MLALSRALVLVLLIVDWVEDPHFGNYLFSRPLASSDVSPLDLGFRSGQNHDKKEGDSLGLQFAGLGMLPTICIPLEERAMRIDRSRDSMYVFMSLQL